MTMRKCSECGYLALKDEISKNLFEVEPDVRKKGEYLNSNGHPRIAQFFCYENKRKFTEDLFGSSTRMAAAIAEDFDCDNGFVDAEKMLKNTKTWLCWKCFRLVTGSATKKTAIGERLSKMA